MHLCLFEDDRTRHLFPLTRVRPVYDLRIGRRTLAERLFESFDAPVVLHSRAAVADVTCQEYDRLVNHLPGEVDVLFVNGRWFAEEGDLLDAIRRAARPGEPGRVFVQGEDVVAAWVPRAGASLVKEDFLSAETFGSMREEKVDAARMVARLWHPLDLLEEALRSDFDRATGGYNVFERPGADISDGVLLSSAERILVGPRARIRPGAILSAEEGPIHIDHDAVVFEGAVVRGPCYIGPHSQVKMGAKIEIVCAGPWCKIDGDVHDSIMHSYANKAHAGFFGHAYMGRWCNVGAGTNNSNLRNDYGPVSVYNPVAQDFEATDRQFFGLIMGDHSKCGINSMFNTATVVGISCNIYGTGFPPRHIPSFSWGTPDHLEEYRLEKALRVAEAAMARRNVPLTKVDRALLGAVFADTSSERRALLGAG